MTMTNNNEYPQSLAGQIEYGDTLTDSEGNVLPIVDAFCKGYAEAILFANAYHYISEDDYIDADGEHELELDSDAQYAYQSPGKWWEGMGIDYTDAVDFLAANIVDLATIAVQESLKVENRFLTAGSIAWSVYEQHGQDFALTRNGHGAGFWDRGYGEAGDRLSDTAHRYGEHSVLTDDGPTVETL